jgi:serine/threonine-protein kinase RsbW
MLRSKELKMKSELQEIHKLEDFVEQISDVFNINSTYYSNILVALNEAVTNSIIHGNKSDKNKMVTVLFEAKNKGLFFTVSDEGTGFEFENYPDPTDITIQNYTEIGRGLYLIKSLSDSIVYDTDRKLLEIGFTISSINKELAVSRIQSLHEYFKTANKSVEV